MSSSKSLWRSLLILVMLAGLYMLYISTAADRKVNNVNGKVLILSPDTTNPNWPVNPTEQKAAMDDCRITMLKRLADLDFISDTRVDVKNGKIEVFLPGDQENKEAEARITSGAALELYLLTDIQSESNPVGKWRMQEPIHTGEAFTFISPIGERIDTHSNPRKFLTSVVGAPRIKPVFKSDDFLSNAKATRSKNKFAVLEVAFNRESGKRFAEFTRNHIGGVLAVIYGGKLLMAPEIQEEIPDGKAQITGFANIDEAQRMAEMINSGTLAVGFHIDSEKTIKPGN